MEQKSPFYLIEMRKPLQYFALSFVFLLMSTMIQVNAQNPGNVINENITWLNPLPQGLDINRVRPFGTHSLLAVGKAGTMIRSTDNGQNWTYMKFPIYSDFYSIHFLDSNRVYVVGAGASGATYVYYSDDGANSFSQRYFDANISMRDIFFVNDSLGFMCGAVGRVAKTTDGGFSWNTQLTGVAQVYTSISFLNADTGFVGSSGTGLRRTYDGGQSWTAVTGYFLTDSYRVGFVNDTLGYVTTYGNRISRTTNGGVNWTTVFNPGLSDFNYDFYMLNKDTGIAVSGSYVYRTTNGINWSGPFLLTGNIRTCAITKSGTAVVSGFYGQIRYDASMPYSNFVNYDNQATGDLYNRIEFFNSSIGFICTDYGYIYKTTNAGQTWTAYRDTNLFADSFMDIAVIGSNKIAVTNFDGDVLVSSNNGQTFSVFNVNGQDPMYAIDFPSASVGYAVGANGKVVKTVNGGSSWTNLSFPSTSLPLKDVEFIDPTTGYIGGNGGYVYKTTNGGVSWSDVFVSGLWEIQQIYFVSQDTGWAIDNYGVVAKTIDGSATWTITDTIGLNLQTADLKFFDANFGIACGRSNLQSGANYSLTRDGGETWTDYAFYINTGLKGVYIADTTRVFFSGENSAIIFTGDSLLVTTMAEKNLTGETTFNIFPNPVQDVLYMPFTEMKNRDIIISDMEGKALIERMDFHETSLNVSSLAAGVYLLHFQNQYNQFEVRKFIKK